MEPTVLSSGSSGKPSPVGERLWLPLAIAVVAVGIVAGALLLMRSHRKPPPTAASAVPDPYAVNIALTNLAMSESSNLAGGKVTYLDGHIANTGGRSVTAVTVEVIFRDFAKKVAQREAMPLMLVRMREPYIDTETVAASPLKAGAGQDFRLNFDQVSPDWAGELPELRVLTVQTK